LFVFWCSRLQSNPGGLIEVDELTDMILKQIRDKN
jgi:hypothetical protein